MRIGDNILRESYVTYFSVLSSCKERLGIARKSESFITKMFSLLVVRTSMESPVK
jgi:hypothetical protein